MKYGSRRALRTVRAFSQFRVQRTVGGISTGPSNKTHLSLHRWARSRFWRDRCRRANLRTDHVARNHHLHAPVQLPPLEVPLSATGFALPSPVADTLSGLTP